MRSFRLLSLLLMLPAGLSASFTHAQTPPAGAQAVTTTAEDDAATPPPFGATLFTGQFAAMREDGINSDYRVLPGDRVQVNVWGEAELNDVFAVDAQGNLFLPGVGPVQVAGLQAGQLTSAVQAAVRRRYRGNIGVYTNLLTASPVAVFVTGSVNRPGRYAGIASDSVLFYLDQAGGPDARTGSYRRISILRGGQPLVELDLYDFLLRGTLDTPQFQDGDAILVGPRGPTVEVTLSTGEMTLVELKEGEDSAELVARVARPGARDNEVSVRGVREGVHFSQAMTMTEFSSYTLEDGDQVVFREAGLPEQINVRLRGEFQGPSVISVPRGSRLIDVLNHVPIDPSIAHFEAVHLERASVARQQRQTIQDSLDRLQRATMLALSDSSGEAQIRVREAELMQNFIQRARTIQPLGRVVTSISDTQLNVRLEDGDVIVIPRRTNVVRVGGEVQVTQALMFHPELEVRDYIARAGGYSNRAETRRVIIMRANAEVVLADSNAPIRPGDEILVPPRIDPKVFQHAIDISQIVYQIAIAASVLLRV